MHRKTITLRDIAQRAGVGVSTVSYVLNGHADHVSPATQVQILNIARELGYRPNAIARSMVRKKTAIIGLIITELQNPLFFPVTVGVEEILWQEGYQIILVNADTVEREIAAIDTMRGQQVDGLIIMSLTRRYPTDHLRALMAEEFPFIVINRDLDDPDIYQIQVNDRGAGRAATDYLIHAGHHRIGVVTGPMSDTPDHRQSAVERYTGWLEALTAHDLPVHPEWIIPGGYTFEGGYRAVYDLFKQHGTGLAMPDALFVSSDMMAVGALKAFYDLGIRLPDDLALVTIGDPPYAAYTTPALTTFKIPIAEAGLLAAQMIVQWIKDGNPVGPHLTTLDFVLTVRESCGTQRQSNAQP